MSYQLNTNIQSSTLYLDSTNCISRSPTYKYDLATAVTCPSALRLLMSVQGITLPNVINNITENNNTFSLQTNHSPTLTNFTITIPVGIYSAWSFRDYLNSQFIARSIPVTCIYSTNSFKYTFVSSYDFNIKNTTNHPTTCGNIIGVGKSDDNEFIYPLVAGAPYFSVAMPSTVNFIATPYIFLKMNNITLTNINSLGVINNSLVRFPVNCEYGQMIQYRPTEQTRFLIQRSDITSVELYLEDIYNNRLSIPSGAELQVILKFEYVYPAAVQSDYDAGTIPHYFRTNPPPDNVNEDDGGLGEV